MTAIPTSPYDLWKSDADLDEDAHEHDEHCPDDCAELTLEDLVEIAAERRAEDMASDRYWGTE